MTTKIFTAAACFAAALSSAFAWGPEGHRIVAHIAERRLNDNARALLAELLPPEQQISDNYICNWPDYIRKDQPETGPWHFVDIPFEAEGYDEARDCANKQCVVEQIPLLEAAVTNTNLTQEKRHEALSFLVHLVGDMHQPLHCADRDGDRGGNLRTIVFPGIAKETNLHSVWDTYLPRACLNGVGPLEYGDNLNDGISGRQARKWSKGTPVDWANQSHAVAVESAYAGLPPAGGPPVHLSTDYVKANKRVILSQWKKAGVRLANILNQIAPPAPEESVRPPAPEYSAPPARFPPAPST